MFNKLNSRRGGFTLVEIMIVVAIIALLAAIAVPGFLRARKRSQASRILNDLRMIDSAVDQYAIETNRSYGNTVAVAGLDQLPEEGFDALQHGQRPLGQCLRYSDGRHLPKVQRPTTITCCRTWPAPGSGPLTARNRI